MLTELGLEPREVDKLMLTKTVDQNVTAWQMRVIQCSSGVYRVHDAAQLVLDAPAYWYSQ